MFCKYKNLFGEVGTGAHSIRFMNIAIIDVIFTAILAKFLQKIHTTLRDNRKQPMSFLYYFISLLLLSIVAHRLFCVRTTIDKLLF